MCLFFAIAAHSQALRIDSTRFYCNGNAVTFDEITDIIQTKDRGFAFVGRAGKPGGGILSPCPGSGANPCMGKLDSLGNIEWIKNWCDTALWARTVCQTADGGYAIDGGNPPYSSFKLARYDAQGNYLWQKNYGWGAGGGSLQYITTPDNGFLLLGFAADRDSDILITYDYPPQTFYTIDWVLIKLDSLGNKQWVRTLGTSGDELHAAVLVCDGKSYYLVGCTDSKDYDCADVAGHPGFAIYTIKLDSLGNVLWSKAHGAGFVSDVLFDERDNSILVTGRAPGRSHEFAGLPTYGYDDIFLMKIDTAGNYKWGNMFGTANYEEDGAAVCKAPNGGYFVAGSNYGGSPTVSSGLLISADSNGQLLDQRSVAGVSGGQLFTVAIFPYKNSYCLFGGTYAMQLSEGTGQNCSTSTVWGSRALMLSTLSVIPLSVSEPSFPEKDFTLSPNPTRNSVEVRFEGRHPKGGLTIANTEGKSLLHQRVGTNESSITINTASWPPGIYMVCFQAEGKTSQCQKLIVQ